MSAQDAARTAIAQTAARGVAQQAQGPAKSLFDKIIGQPRVRTFLARVVAQGAVCQAYLFVGPPGSGKTEAAWALAAAILCDEGGCGCCDSCLRVAHRTHPDVRSYEPAGAQGYVIGQIRDIVHDASLSPVRGSRKVYIINRADRLGTASSNAFLKTLEEPPADTVFILLGRIREQVLPTIASRCQVVPFSPIPPEECAAILSQLTGCSREQAIRALAACGGSIARARTFLATPSRREVRHRVLDVLDSISALDDLGVLTRARELLSLIKAPLETVRQEQASELERSRDLLGRGGVKELERRQKRDLTQRERAGLSELFAIVRSWLRDVLIIASAADRTLLVNGDHDAGLIRQGAHLAPGAVARAVGAVDEAETRISYNVSSQLAIEVMLFQIREVLSWPRS